MRLVFTVLLSFFVGTQRAAPIQNTPKLPYETQKAQCTITSGDIQASAEATVSKTMEGVCGSDEMKRAFENLELKLMEEIADIKKLLTVMSALESTTAGALEHNTEQTERITKIKYSVDTSKISNELSIQQESKNYLMTKAAIPKNTIIGNSRSSPRDAEIQKLNNTVLTGGEIKLFAYYWKINNYSKKMQTDISTELSPVFSILGKHLRLKAIFNHLNRDFLFLKLDKASDNIHEKYNSIILETDGMFQQIQSKINFKHKIAILEQTTPSNDLMSQEFTNIDNGFLIPNSALLSRSYLKNDTILIKLIMYL